MSIIYKTKKKIKIYLIFLREWFENKRTIISRQIIFHSIRDEWKIENRWTSSTWRTKGWNYSWNYSLWKIQVWRIALTMPDHLLSLYEDVEKRAQEKKKRKTGGEKKKKSMKRGEYCVYKRLSGAIFSQTIFWFTANQQDCATRRGWKMHGVEIKEEKRYKYIFEVFFLFAMEGRKKRRARFAFGVEK